MPLSCELKMFKIQSSCFIRVNMVKREREAPITEGSWSQVLASWEEAGHPVPTTACKAYLDL